MVCVPHCSASAVRQEPGGTSNVAVCDNATNVKVFYANVFHLRAPIPWNCRRTTTVWIAPSSRLTVNACTIFLASSSRTSPTAHKSWRPARLPQSQHIHLGHVRDSAIRGRSWELWECWRVLETLKRRYRQERRSIGDATQELVQPK